MRKCERIAFRVTKKANKTEKSTRKNKQKSKISEHLDKHITTVTHFVQYILDVASRDTTQDPVSMNKTSVPQSPVSVASVASADSTTSESQSVSDEQIAVVTNRKVFATRLNTNRKSLNHFDVNQFPFSGRRCAINIMNSAYSNTFPNVNDKSIRFNRMDLSDYSK